MYSASTPEIRRIVVFEMVSDVCVRLGFTANVAGKKSIAHYLQRATLETSTPSTHEILRQGKL